MSYSISTLLIRTLRDVFGENDPARRRAAIDEIYNEDCVFYCSRESGLCFSGPRGRFHEELCSVFSGESRV
jgi:hypothetical protein